jgi:four helix bundle protein
MVRDFRDLVAWQLAETLKCEVFAFTESGPPARDFRFRDDIRASSASAPANIAEGFGRFRPLQFAHFLGIAKASLVETQNHLIDARKRRYIGAALFSRLRNLAKAAERATTNLLRSKLRQADEERNRRRALNKRREHSSRSPEDGTSSPAPDHRGASPPGDRGKRTKQ